MHIPTLPAAASRAALAALVLGWTPGLMAQAPEAGQYQSWSRAIDTLAAKGYPRIEELELRRGGFEAEAIDAQGVEHRLRLGSDGELKSDRAGHRHDDPEDSLDLATLRAALAWLPGQGLAQLHEISGDDGWIEIEGQATDGSARSLRVDPRTLTPAAGGSR